MSVGGPGLTTWTAASSTTGSGYSLHSSSLRSCAGLSHAVARVARATAPTPRAPTLAGSVQSVTPNRPEINTAKLLGTTLLAGSVQTVTGCLTPSGPVINTAKLLGTTLWTRTQIPTLAGSVQTRTVTGCLTPNGPLINTARLLGTIGISNWVCSSPAAMVCRCQAWCRCQPS